MFTFLRKKQEKNNNPNQYYLPNGLRVYAVGDIHGRADLLKTLHQRIIADAARASKFENLVVYLGDYVDRGFEVHEVLDTLIAGLPGNFQPFIIRPF